MRLITEEITRSNGIVQRTELPAIEFSIREIATDEAFTIPSRRQLVVGRLTVASGGSIHLESGASLKLIDA